MGRNVLVQAVTDTEKNLVIDSNNEIKELPKLFETYVAFTQI